MGKVCTPHPVASLNANKTAFLSGLAKCDIYKYHIENCFYSL